MEKFVNIRIDIRFMINIVNIHSILNISHMHLQIITYFYYEKYYNVCYV